MYSYETKQKVGANDCVFQSNLKDQMRNKGLTPAHSFVVQMAAKKRRHDENKVEQRRNAVLKSQHNENVIRSI